MPSSNSSTSITETKTAFLQSQARLLSAPLTPSPTWQDQASSSSDDPPLPLPDKVVTDVLVKVNAKLKSHNRLVFSPPTQRHVVEQIDALYWSEVVGESDTVSRGDDIVWISKDADLTVTEVVQGLPATLDRANEDEDGDQDADGDENQQDQYTRLRDQVTDQVHRRDELKKRVESYRRLRSLLEPFEDARENVQPNLVGREAEMSRELERMRVLVARVEAGLGKGVGREGRGGVRIREREGGDGNGNAVQGVWSESGVERVKRAMDLG